MPRIRHNSRKKILANSLFNATANTNNNSSPHAHRSVSMSKFSMHTNWFLIAHISNKCSGNHDTFYTRYRKFVFHFTARQSSKNEKKTRRQMEWEKISKRKPLNKQNKAIKVFFPLPFALKNWRVQTRTTYIHGCQSIVCDALNGTHIHGIHVSAVCSFAFLVVEKT